MQPLSLLCLSKEFWDSPRRARKHLLFEALQKQLSVGELLYINPFLHRWCSREINMDTAQDMDVWQGKFLLPGERFAPVRSVNRWMAYRQLRLRLAKKNWTTFFYDPWDVTLARNLKKHGPVFFDWTDDWELYYDDPAIGSNQKSAVREASAVITVTDNLRRQASDLRMSDKEVLWLPNATGWQPVKSAPCSPELARVPSPRLGFVGHLGPWFDADLVASLAERHPDWHWVLVGAADPSKYRQLSDSDNIYLLGQKPYNELQGFMANCDVLVAPYISRIEGDATKLYDYLTLGLPIVSTDIETARRLHPHVRTAFDLESWQTGIDQALKEADPSRRKARRQESRRHTWDARAAALLAWLVELQAGQKN
jgi:glycosyltransferase involved in cell wall biosynthesis